MTSRTATCSCGQLRAICGGEPIRRSLCHCLDCQRRTGSVFAVQARYPADAVVTEGCSSTWSRRGDSGGSATFHFCPTCSAIVWWQPTGGGDWIAIPAGAFADPDLPPPTVSVYEDRQHPWTRAIAEQGIEHQT